MASDEMPQTEVRENARWELLRHLAWFRDWHRERWPDQQVMSLPLYEGEWQNRRDDIWLAAEEAGKLGDIEFHDLRGSADVGDRMLCHLRGGREAFVRITDQGYETVRRHDGVGELLQEVSRG